MSGYPKLPLQAHSSTSTSSNPAALQPQSGSWSGTRPVPENTPAAPITSHQDSQSTASSTRPSAISRSTSDVDQRSTATSSAESSMMVTSTTTAQESASKDSTGFKIRVPRDLPNIPDAFRKRRLARSQPSTSPSSRDSPLHSRLPTVRSRSTGSEPLIQTKFIAPRTATDKSKRTHNEMLSDEAQAPRAFLTLEARPGSEKRTKAVKQTIAVSKSAEASPRSLGRLLMNPIVSKSKLTPLVPTDHVGPSGAFTSHLNSTTEPAIDTTIIKQEEITDIPTLVAQNSSPQPNRKRGRTRSGSISPAVEPIRFPTPTSLGGAPGEDDDSIRPVNLINLGPVPLSVTTVAPQTVEASSESAIAELTRMHETRSSELERASSSIVEPAAQRETSTPPPSISTVSSMPDPKEPQLSPLELVRAGTAILNRLVSNPTCKIFVNTVPLSVTNYHAVIKKPMDLTTVEHRLWRGFEIRQNAAGEPLTPGLIAATSHINQTEGYSTLQEFERDLRRIFQNATYFNSPQNVIYKEAQAYSVLYQGLVLAYRERRLIPEAPLPQEIYSPSLISLSEPGPVYLFRAHQLKEMERKMTDISVDLFANLHQPLFRAMYSQEELTPEKPLFVRMYISKNRSILAKCRDEKSAKVVIFSDYRAGKPFTVAPRVSTEGAAKTIGGDTRMVRIKARVMIAKPIGERHDMITVGDLDCPSSWTMVTCVRTFDLEVDVPAKYEKGTLSKMRHELVRFGTDSKINPEHQQVILDALGLKLHGGTGNETSNPMTNASKAANQVKPATMAATPSAPSAALNIAVAEPGAALLVTQQDTAVNRDDQPLIPKLKVDIQDLHLVVMPPPTALDELKAASAVTSSMGFQDPVLSIHGSSFSSLSSNADITHVPPTLPNHETPSSDVPRPEDTSMPMAIIPAPEAPAGSARPSPIRLTNRQQQMLLDLKAAAREKNVPYLSWSDIEPTLTADSAQGLYKRIYHVDGDDGLVVQNFKEMDTESFEQRVREVICLLMLRDLDGVGQIQSVISDGKDHVVGLSMTKYAYTLKAYATSARRHPSPCQKLSLIRDMIAAVSAIHGEGLAHRDLSEVNIMIDEDPTQPLQDSTPRPLVRVIDFGKSVFINTEQVKRWSMKDPVPDAELAILPLVALPPDHGYKLYRSILTLPRTKFDNKLLPPVDPQLEDVYSLGVLIWRTFSGKSPWNGAIEDDLRTIRYLVRSDDQIRFQLEREVAGRVSRELLLKCLTAEAETRWTAQQLREWTFRPEISAQLLAEFEVLGGGRKRMRKNLD